VFPASFPRGGPPCAGAPPGQSIVAMAACTTAQSCSVRLAAGSISCMGRVKPTCRLPVNQTATLNRRSAADEAAPAQEFCISRAFINPDA